MKQLLSGLVIAMVLTGCAGSPSPNHEARQLPVDMLIIHYTGMIPVERAIAWLSNPESKVSAHYVIAEDGTITPLVDEDRRAWHAGVSFWGGETDTNSRSIGIELDNPGPDFGYHPFPAAQMQALARLSREIMARHAIPQQHVLGHSDVAVGRKIDPGDLFPWAWLAQQGVGVWPFDNTEWDDSMTEEEALRRLARYGYDISNPRETIRAFQLHFRPELTDGLLDPATAGRIRKLIP